MFHGQSIGCTRVHTSTGLPAVLPGSEERVQNLEPEWGWEIRPGGQVSGQEDGQHTGNPCGRGAAAPCGPAQHTVCPACGCLRQRDPRETLETKDSGDLSSQLPHRTAGILPLHCPECQERTRTRTRTHGRTTPHPANSVETPQLPPLSAGPHGLPPSSSSAVCPALPGPHNTLGSHLLSSSPHCFLKFRCQQSTCTVICL